MEAMACGCPTVYSRRTSGPELIEHERNGLLIDPDRPAEIADAMIRLLGDDALARRLGEAARKHVEERFSVRIMTAGNEAFYEACLSDFRRQARWRSAVPGT
jgi:glycosyltransferase involved in cell wall biosynthesis